MGAGVDLGTGADLAAGFPGREISKSSKARTSASGSEDAGGVWTAREASMASKSGSGSEEAFFEAALTNVDAGLEVGTAFPPEKKYKNSVVSKFWCEYEMC